MTRLEAADKLEKFGWALIRYAQMVRREIATPTYDNVLASLKWRERAQLRMAAFTGALRGWRGR